MNNLKERLQNIKDEVAKDFHNSTFIQAVMFTNNVEIIEMMDEICKRYAEEVIKEASERAEISISGNENFLELLNSNEENEVNSDDLANCKITVSKQSILKLIEEL